MHRGDTEPSHTERGQILNAMQVDAVHVNVNQEQQMGVAHAQTRAWVAMAAKASPRKEARARREERKRPPSLMVNAGIARRGFARVESCDEDAVGGGAVLELGAPLEGSGTIVGT